MNDFDYETETITEWIPYDASETLMKSSLEALSQVDSVQVVRDGPDLQGGYTWTLTLPDPQRDSLDLQNTAIVDPLFGQDVPLFQVVASTLNANFSPGSNVMVKEIRAGNSFGNTCSEQNDCKIIIQNLSRGAGYTFRILGKISDEQWDTYSWESKLVFIPNSIQDEVALKLTSISSESLGFSLSTVDNILVQISENNVEDVWETITTSTPGTFLVESLKPNTKYQIRYRQKGRFRAVNFKTYSSPVRSNVAVAQPLSAHSAMVNWQVSNNHVSMYQIQYRQAKHGRYAFQEALNSGWKTIQELVKKGPVAEIQKISCVADQVITAGAFKLSFKNQISDFIAFDATADEFKSALESLTSNIGRVVRSSISQGCYAWTIQFDPLHGDQQSVVVVAETLSQTAPGTRIIADTIRQGIPAEYFEYMSTLDTTVDGMEPYTWYTFRIRERSGSEFLDWSEPSDPVRTYVAEDVPAAPSVLEQAAGRVLVSNGNQEQPPETSSPYYMNGVGVGGIAGSDGGPGLVVISPLSSDNSPSSESTMVFMHDDTFQSYRVPDNPTIDRLYIRAWGAGGGSTSFSTGGSGGYTEAVISVLEVKTDAVTPRLVQLVVFVGRGGSASSLTSKGGFGGFGGGGDGGPGVSRSGAGGGGASYIRTNNDRILLVAAGGGGAGASHVCCSNGGAGSGLNGSSPIEVSGFTINALSKVYAEHNNVQFGEAPLADYSILATGGNGATICDGDCGGIPGSSGTYVSAIDRPASSGLFLKGGYGASGENGGGGGGGGLYGGGGGGAGFMGAGKFMSIFAIIPSNIYRWWRRIKLGGCYMLACH